MCVVGEAGLDLDRERSRGIDGDEIDLAAADGDVAASDGGALTRQEISGNPFTERAEPPPMTAHS